MADDYVPAQARFIGYLALGLMAFALLFALFVAYAANVGA